MVAIPNPPRVGDMPKSEPVPEGHYHIRCDKAELVKTAKGENMISAQFTIFGPEEQEQYHGRKLFENFMMEGQGLFRTRQFFEACGEGEDFLVEDSEQFEKREVAAVVQIEAGGTDPKTKKAYGPRNVVKRYLAIGG